MKRHRRMFLPSILLAIIISCIVIPLLLVSVTHFTIRKSDDFIYKYKKDPDGTKHAVILDLTQQGKNKDVIIIPENINGYPVTQVGELRTRYKFSSPNAKKVFLPYQLLFTNIEISSYNIFYFYKTTYENVQGRRNPYLSVLKNTPELNTINNCSDVEYANLIYCYNYDDSPSSGYYWIDWYDDELIWFQPPTPQRIGYVFAGWYKEPECRTPWNFEVDYMPKQNYNEDHYFGDGSMLIITKLYANWEKI